MTNHFVEKLAVSFILILAAPQSFAWEMFGDVIFIGQQDTRAVTRMMDPDHDTAVQLTDAELFEAGQSVAEDEDVCIYKTLCSSSAIDPTFRGETEYCGKGSAAKGSAVLVGFAYPWNIRKWGEEVPVCKTSASAEEDDEDEECEDCEYVADDDEWPEPYEEEEEWESEL